MGRFAGGREVVDVAALVEIVDAGDGDGIVGAQQVPPCDELVEVAADVVLVLGLDVIARPAHAVERLGRPQLDDVMVLRLVEGLDQGPVGGRVRGSHVVERSDLIEQP